MNIVPTSAGDIPAMQKVLEETGLFPPEMLPDMMRRYLADADCLEQWLTCARDGEFIGFCFAAPEPLAEGSWNMLAIAVHPDAQGCGAGSRLVGALESTLRRMAGRILIADTSGTAEYARTRAFYRKNGYHQEAVIRDFWAAGADKVTFWKRLA